MAASPTKRITTGAILLALSAIGIISLVVLKGPKLEAHHARPQRVMGTKCLLTAVVPAGRGATADEALRAAEAQLRAVEALMSRRLDNSEIARFNAAPAGKLVKLSPRTLTLLRQARALAEQTDGAFDVTICPIIELWTRAGIRQRLPTDVELVAAREASRWEYIALAEGGASKDIATAGVDLGGIAKGYGIDAAIEAMKQAGAAGGLVDVGGDVRCFGAPAGKNEWRVEIRDPFRPGEPFGVLALREGAVCTSGNYFRFTEIAGRRYSHIIDPRTGLCVDFAPSVTVVAPDATTADPWATALSVLGDAGLELLTEDDGMEAMVVLGRPDDYRVSMTDGFERLLDREHSGPLLRGVSAAAAATGPKGGD